MSSMPSTSPLARTFYADAVLFDMDGTLTDSIAAVEAAWGKVANDLGKDAQEVIDATHGKRAIDNLRALRPDLARTKTAEMKDEVQGFEESILYYADAYNMHGPGSRRNSMANSTPNSMTDTATPDLTPGSSAPSSRALSTAEDAPSSFISQLRSRLSVNAVSDMSEFALEDEEGENIIMARSESMNTAKNMEKPLIVEPSEDEQEAWQVEAAAVDRSVRILPGVREMIDSLPEGRYAVATSGAHTYAFGCMNRVGITPPPVTITADDKRLKAGKPAPDPFLLAAKCLGYDANRCVVFEDSPSGIRAGVASGAIVIAVCTSHEREKIEGCGAHYIVENMESVQCVFDDVEQRLKFTVSI